ncbi:hypothetical protein FOMPIDRAFT_1022869 [Fomitopsis schrenkii]|uniref:SAP domain-containing protein n=1 Tax=Fomitopsis schrenkii TaxID=2126942 RepID=S8ED53_FOMSC|nr:hypothetical protein FOMPIDRAFT_1022869 [Fomitopsis schrenkii]
MATSNTNAGGPSNGDAIQLNSALLLDTAAIREMLGLMKGSLGTIGQQFQTLNEQSKKVETFGPSKESLKAQADALEDEMKSVSDRRGKLLEHVKTTTIKEQLKDKVAKQMRDHILEQIRTSVTEQVKLQLNRQIRQHLPDSLKEQVEASRKQIEGVKVAFRNSEARRTNALLRTDRLDDQLAEVSKPDDTESKLYPRNLRSLFAYTPDQAQALARDYGLTATGAREDIINRFMKHVGVSFPLLWMFLGTEQ